MKKIVLIAIAVALLLSSFYFYNQYKENMKTYHKSDVYFTIKSGDTLSKITDELFNKKIIKSKTFFKLYTRYKGLDTKLKSGSYLIKAGIDIDELLKKLSSGKSDYKIITIPEGFNLHQIAQRLENNGFIKKDELLNAKISDYDKANLFDNDKKVFYELEGYLFPDTYYIPYTAQSTEVISILFNQFAKNYSQEFRNRAKELGLKNSQIITIASLIEKEAANDDERKRIAGVIYNRLRLNMPLQIDATVIYGITKGEKNIPRLYNKDYQYESVYNTYKFTGLPPGPIASPGIKSIEAALYPEEHDYLYYVYTGEGHVFSKTYQEHLKNVNKYIK
ncbi:putative aminodeoxychorismate lyase [Caloramator mitchellensis]|uniref:Endolytic murein transglycosylase n=1 Tax=Caloramator mitchellensis TaxID=908809 RepID=A0A0R3K272_CALMK|nr:endolytic transglycosylase MltG [Caloramator mitchellensis]KRQ87372.1 putative aminodeoxychorismate lyase [Caloramator mitchellensis]